MDRRPRPLLVAGVLALVMCALLVPMAKRSVDSALADEARAALISADLDAVSVTSDWASLTLRGPAPLESRARAAAGSMSHASAVDTVTYVVSPAAGDEPPTDVGAPDAGPTGDASPSTPSPATPPSASAAPSAGESPPADATPTASPSSSPAAPAEPDARQVKLSLGPVYRDGGLSFADDSTAMTPQSRKRLDATASALLKAPNVTLRIIGHTDARGDAARNLRLSRDRASAVRDYLITRGVSGSRLTTDGYGETRPLLSNSTETGRLANRRVELLFRDR